MKGLIRYCCHALTAAAVLWMLLQTGGCTSTISALHKGPITRDHNSISLGAAIDDRIIETVAEVNLDKAGEKLKESHVDVEVYNGTVLLAGQVPDKESKQRASEVVSGVKGVRKVYNQLEITSNTAWLTRTSDLWLTAKIKSKMLTAEGFPSSKIKVTTENGVVFLMGLVTPVVASKAVAIVQKTGGVQKIVKVFDYLR